MPHLACHMRATEVSEQRLRIHQALSKQATGCFSFVARKLLQAGTNGSWNRRGLRQLLTTCTQHEITSPGAIPRLAARFARGLCLTHGAFRSPASIKGGTCLFNTPVHYTHSFIAGSIRNLNSATSSRRESLLRLVFSLTITTIIIIITDDITTIASGTWSGRCPAAFK